MPDEKVIVTTEEAAEKPKKGFAALSKEKVTKIARLGGKTAHAVGKAHTYNITEARAAGKKGGKASGIAKRKKKEAHLKAVEEAKKAALAAQAE